MRRTDLESPPGPASPLTPADIAHSLASERGKRNVNRLAARMARDGVDFEAFIEEIRSREMPVKWYMTWLLARYVVQNRDHGTRAQHLIWDLLEGCENDSMKRDLWRALGFVDVDDHIAGEVFDRAMGIVASPSEGIAVRAHAMLAARNVAHPYPELRNELGLVLEGLRTDQSPAVRARSRNILLEFTRLRRATKRRSRKAGA